VELATKCNALRSELLSNCTARPASEFHVVAASAQSPISHLGPRKKHRMPRDRPWWKNRPGPWNRHTRKRCKSCKEQCSSKTGKKNHFHGKLKSIFARIKHMARKKFRKIKAFHKIKRKVALAKVKKFFHFVKKKFKATAKKVKKKKKGTRKSKLKHMLKQVKKRAHHFWKFLKKKYKKSKFAGKKAGKKASTKKALKILKKGGKVRHFHHFVKKFIKMVRAKAKKRAYKVKHLKPGKRKKAFKKLNKFYGKIWKDFKGTAHSIKHGTKGTRKAKLAGLLKRVKQDSHKYWHHLKHKYKKPKSKKGGKKKRL